MTKSRIILDKDYTLAALDRRLFGTFVEHLGRCVYEGIFEPDHPTADEHGFRKDVLDLVKELGPTIVRYPGGNFLSGYNWEDGVGPHRPKRLDLAWFSTETNLFGTNEFIQWCRLASVEPMLGVNLGTRGADEARRFLEYCNFASGTALSDLRKEHGFPEPHNVKFWCLGNEMDGPWQICRKTAAEYGRTAAETAKLMRWLDPSVELAACGSSARFMTTFGTWEHEVLQHTFEYADYISIHLYFENQFNDPKEFLANPDLMDLYIREVISVCDGVAAERKSTKRMMLSFDEWNVWYKARGGRFSRQPNWPEAPHLLEEIYDLQDALVVGGALITLMNNADRVKSACLAQLVNVIGPIMTEKDGPAWRQTIFYPFSQVAKMAKGTVLRPIVHSSKYQTITAGEIAHLSASAVQCDDNEIAIFILNRDLSNPTSLEIDLRSFGQVESIRAFELTGDDLLATNTRDNPNAVKPEKNSTTKIEESGARIDLKTQSWNVINIRLR